MHLLKRLFLAAGIAMIASGAAFAAAEPDEAIKYRKNVMKSVGGHTGVVAAIIQGKAGTPDALAPHARGLYLSATTALEAFRQNTDGSGREETTAKGNVWSDWANFESKMNDFVEASRKMADAAEAGSAGGAELQALGGSCKACHDDFRTK